MKKLKKISMGGIALASFVLASCSLGGLEDLESIIKTSDIAETTTADAGNNNTTTTENSNQTTTGGSEEDDPNVTYEYDENHNVIAKIVSTYDENGNLVSKVITPYKNGVPQDTIQCWVDSTGKESYFQENKILYEAWKEGELSVLKTYVYDEETNTIDHILSNYKDANGNIVKVFYQKPQEEHPELVAYTTETIFTPNGKTVTYIDYKPTEGTKSVSVEVYDTQDVCLNVTLTVYDGENIISKQLNEYERNPNGTPKQEKYTHYDVTTGEVTYISITYRDENGEVASSEVIYFNENGKATHMVDDKISYEEWEEDGLSVRKDYRYTDETLVALTTTYKDAAGNIVKVFYQKPQEEHPELVAYTTETIFTPNGKTVTYIDYKPTEGTKRVSVEVYDTQDVCLNVTLTVYNGENIISKQLNEYEMNPNGTAKQDKYTHYDVTTGEVTYISITYRDENGVVTSSELVYFNEDGKATHMVDDKISYEEWEEGGLSIRKDYQYTDETLVALTTTYKDADGNIVKVFYQKPQEEHPELVAYTTETVFTPNGKTVTYIDYKPTQGTKRVIVEVYDTQDVCLNVTVTAYDGENIISKQLNEYEMNPNGTPKQDKYTHYDVTTGEVTYISITYHDENGVVTSSETICFYENGKVTHKVNDKITYEEWKEDGLSVQKTWVYTDDTCETVNYIWTKYTDENNVTVRYIEEFPAETNPMNIGREVDEYYENRVKVKTITKETDYVNNIMNVYEETYNEDYSIKQIIHTVYTGTAITKYEIITPEYKDGYRVKDTIKEYNPETMDHISTTVVEYDENGQEVNRITTPVTKD